MIYQPSDDSYLLQEQVKKFSKGKKVLDLGTGSGIQAVAAEKSGAKKVLATDTEEESIKAVKKLGIPAIKSNLFQKIRGKFDLIIFNPPYLPQDLREDSESSRATTGGKKGDELILKFLKQSIEHIRSDGIILLIVSSLTPKIRINNFLKKNILVCKVLSEKKIFFEKLQVWKICKCG